MKLLITTIVFICMFSLALAQLPNSGSNTESTRTIITAEDGLRVSILERGKAIRSWDKKKDY